MSQQGGYAGLLHELQGGALPAPQQTWTGGYAALLHEAQAGQQPLAQPAYAQAPSSDYLLTGTPAPGENRPNVNQPYMPPQPAPRSVAGEFGAAVFRGAETMLAAPRALAFNQPVSELVTPGFEPSPAPAGAGLIRRGAHTTAQVAGGLVPAIGAGVVTAGAATPFIAPMLGTGLAATAASGVAGGVPIATQMAADMSERTGGDPAAVAASFGQNAALGAIPPLAVLNRIPGVRNVVGKAVERFGAGPVMKYLAEVTGDAAVAGGTNVGQAYVDEAIASRAGAAPREVDPVAEFLGGAGAVGALRFASDVGRIQADRARKAKERNAPLPTREQIDAEIAAIFARMTQKERAIAEEQIVIDEIKQRMADPKFDPTSQLGQLREQVQQEFGVSGRRADRLIAAVRGRAAVERAFFQGDNPSAPNIGLVYQAFADENAAQRAANRSPMPVAPGERPEPKIVSNRSAQTIDPRLVQQIIDEYSAARAGPMTQAEGSAGPYRYTGPAGERLNIPTPREYPRALGADEAFAQKYELDPTFGGEILPLEDATWAASTMNAESKLWDYAIVQASADGERWVIARKGRARGGRGGGGGGQAQDGPDLPPYMRQFQPLTNKQQTTNVSRESVAQPIPSPQTPGVGTGAGRVEAEPVQTGGLQGGGPARPGQSTEPDFGELSHSELRAELKRRGMDTRGPRGLLIDRLKNAGKPDPYAFNPEPTPDVPAQAAEDWRQIPDTRTDLNRRIEEKKAQGMSHEDAFKAAQEDLTSEASARLDQDGAILVDEYGDEYLVEHTSSRRGGPKDQRSLVKLTEDGVPYASPNERPWVNPYESLLLARRLRRKIKQTPTPDVPARQEAPQAQKEATNGQGQEEGQGRQEGLLNAPESAPTTENAPAPSVRGAEGVDSATKLNAFERAMLEQEIRRLGKTIPDDALAVLHGERQSTVGGWTADQLLDPSTPGSAKLRQYMEIRQALKGQSPPQPTPEPPSIQPGMVIRSDWAGGSGVRMRLVRPYTHPTGNGWMVNVYDESSRRFSKVEQAVSDQDVANAIGKGRAESASATSPPQPPSASSAPRENGAEGVAKEPWQMTRSEYVSSREAELRAAWRRMKNVDPNAPVDAAFSENLHRREVVRAMDRHANGEGKPVPAEVLADYPDLAPNSPAKPDSSAPTPPEPPASVRGAEGVQQNPREALRAKLAEYDDAGLYELATRAKNGIEWQRGNERQNLRVALAEITKEQKRRKTESASAMSYEEWVAKARFYRSGKTKNAELADGRRVMLSKDSTASNFRTQSEKFLRTIYESSRQPELDNSPPQPPKPPAQVPPRIEAQAQNPDGGAVAGGVAQAGKGTDQPLPKKHIQHSINQILKADQTISAGKIDKKRFESAWATIRTHAPRLGIEVPDMGTYFYADRYREAAGKVVVQIGQKFGEFPTQELRDRRDASLAESERIRRKEPRPEPKVETPATTTPKAPEYAKIDGESTIDLAKRIGVQKFLYERDIADNTAVGIFKQAINEIPNELNVDDVLVMAKNIARMDKRPAVDGASMAEAITYRSNEGARKYAREMDKLAQENAAKGRKFQLADDGGSMAGQRARKIIGDPPYKAEPPPTPQVSRTEPATETPNTDNAPTTIGKYHVYRDNQDRWHAGWIDQSGAQQGRIVKTREDAVALAESWRKKDDDDAKAEQERYATTRNPIGLSEIDGITKRFERGDMTAAAWQNTYKRVLDSEKEIKAELNYRKLPELKKMTGPFFRGTKKDAVDAVYNRILNDFNIEDSLSFSPFDDPMGRKALHKAVMGITDERIAKYIEDKKAKRAARDKALTNPETYTEFLTFIQRKGEKALTPEQRAKWDSMRAEQTQRGREQQKEAAARVDRVDTGEIGFEVVEGKHTKTGATLHIVKLTGRVPSDTFKELAQAARKLGGNWSANSKWGPSPDGFNFKTKEDAEAFAKVKDQSVSRAEQVQEARAESEQGAAQRLRTLADSMDERADETLGRDRLTNTARRARIADGVEAQARSEKQMAETLRNIADAIEAGNAKHLRGIRQRTHVEAIQSVLRRAVWDRNQEMANRLGKRVESFEGRKPEAADADLAKYPWPDVYATVVLKQAQDLAKETGAGARYVQWLQRVLGTGEYTKIDSHDGIDRLLELPDAWTKTRDGKMLAERLSDISQNARRLKAANIQTIEELRAAIREYIGMRGGEVKADPIKEAERALIDKPFDGADFFPTPPELARRVAMEADIKPGMTVLEPSAGKGDLMDAVREVEPGASIVGIERLGEVAEIAKLKGHTIERGDFLETQPRQFDRIVMNPPFSNRLDAEHVQRAYNDFLAPGGRLVAIVSEGPFFASDAKSKAFREFIESTGAEVEKLEPGQFSKENKAFRETGVNVRMVTIDKPERLPLPEAKAAAEAPPVNDRLDVVDPNDPDSIIAEIQAKVPQAYYGKASPDDAPWVTRKYQEAGTALVPGVRLGEAEDVGRVYHMMMEGVVSLADYTRLVSELRASGKAPKSGTDSDLQRPTTTEKHKSSVDPETYRNVVKVVDDHRSAETHFKNTSRHADAVATLEKNRADVDRVIEDVRKAIEHLPESDPKTLDLPPGLAPTWKQRSIERDNLLDSMRESFRGIEKDIAEQSDLYTQKAKRLGHESPTVGKIREGLNDLHKRKTRMAEEIREAQQEARKYRSARMYAEGDPVQRAVAAINLAKEGRVEGYTIEQARVLAAFEHVMRKVAPEDAPQEAIKAAAESATQQHLQGTSRTMLESIDGRLENTIKAHLRKDIPAQATFGEKNGLTYQEIRALEQGIERAGTIEEARALVKTAQELDAQRKAEWEAFSKTQAEAAAKAEQERRANSLVIDEPNVKVWWYGEDQTAKAKAIKEIQSITTKPVYTRTRYPGDPTTRKLPVWKGKSQFKSKADMLKELATFAADSPTRDYDINQVHIDQDGARAMAMNGPWLVGVLGGKGEYGAPTQLRAPDVQWMVDEVFDPAIRVATVNVLDTARHLKRAKLMTSEERPAAFVVKNKDGTLGFATRSPGEGHAEINVKDGGEVIGMINPEYMLNALLFAQQNGAIDVHIGHKWTTDNNKKKVNRISIDGTNGSTADRRGPFALLQGLKEQGDAADAITNAKSITDTRPEDARPAPKGKPEQSSPSPQSLGIVPPGTRELWAAIDRAEQIVDRLGEGARITQRAAAFIFGKATTYARLLGPEGKDIARSMERIQKDTTQNTNTDVQAIKKTLAGVSREDVRIIAKIANGRGNWADTRPDLVPYVEKLRPHFDRVMLEARRVGIMRGKGPKKVILEGSGAYVPEVPNAEGRKFIEEIRDPNQSDKQSAAVAAWADKLVADGVVNTPEEAIKRLVDYRDRLRRGLQPYLESFRVPLPEHMVEWDIRETVPPVLERSWQTVEAVREWNSDPKNALGNDGSATLDLLTAKLERIRKSKGNAPADAIQAWADYSFGKKAPNPAQSAFFGAWSNFETLTRLGGSLLSAATNYTQQFVNTARLSPAAVAKAFKDYPPFLHPFMKSAVEARELAERAGGVSDVSALAPLEGQHAGYKLARAALYPFRRVEVTNQVRTSLAAAHQAVADMDLLIRMEGNSPLSGLRKAFESLGSLSGVDTTGGVKRRAAQMLDITPEQLAAKVKRHERLTPEEIADVMHRFSRDTQFLMGVATEPAWFRQSPIGRLAFKFKTWGARQLGLIYRDVVKEARYGNFAPLVRFTVATVVLGEIVQALRDWVKETENSATMYVAGGGRDTGEIAGRVLKSMAGGGAFGMLSDLTYGLGSFAFGPAGSTLGNVADAASGAKDAILTKGGEGLGAVGDRFLRNQIPAYTQADRLFDKTVAAASGDLSELKRQTTLRLWRQRAMDFAKSKQERTVGQKVAGRIDDAIYGRYRVAGEANENTRPFEYAARAIDRGDVDEAADYLRIVLKNTPTGEMDSKVRAIESSLRIRAPLGRVAEKDYGKFLSTYTPEQRREAIKADNRWRADYSKAIGRAMANRWARDDAAD